MLAKPGLSLHDSAWPLENLGPGLGEQTNIRTHSKHGFVERVCVCVCVCVCVY